MSRFLRGLLCTGEHQISPVALKKQKEQIRVCSPLSPGGQKSFLYPNGARLYAEPVNSREKENNMYICFYQVL
jgi:hypothetical protein